MRNNTENILDFLVSVTPMYSGRQRLVSKLAAYVHWAATDSRVVGLNAFHWPNLPLLKPSSMVMGAVAYPRLLAKVAQLVATLQNLSNIPSKTEDSTEERSLADHTEAPSKSLCDTLILKCHRAPA